jgi:hypothetical protein
MSIAPEEILDLDAAREHRAAKREGQGKGLPVRIGGEVIATLPVELPIDVFEPLTKIDDALMLLLREAMQIASGPDAAKKWEATSLVVDLLATTSNLPMTVIEVIKGIAVNLLGQEGFNKFMKARPAREDIAEAIKGVFRFYGVSLGEALPSSASSESDGGTSSTTSEPTSTDSMPEASTGTQDTPTS